MQYLYKAGYDPTAAIDFFERIQSLEKNKPGTLSKVFSTHPPTDDRMAEIQKNIKELLVEKPAYVITTLEFDNIKDRLNQMMNKRKSQAEKQGPTLRKKSSGQIDAQDDKEGKKEDDKDEKPKLKRR